VEDSNYTNTKSILFSSQTHFNPSHVRIRLKQKKEITKTEGPATHGSEKKEKKH